MKLIAIILALLIVLSSCSNSAPTNSPEEPNLAQTARPGTAEPEPAADPNATVTWQATEWNALENAYAFHDADGILYYVQWTPDGDTGLYKTNSDTLANDSAELIYSKSSDDGVIRNMAYYPGGFVLYEYCAETIDLVWLNMDGTEQKRQTLFNTTPESFENAEVIELYEQTNGFPYTVSVDDNETAYVFMFNDRHGSTYLHIANGTVVSDPLFKNEIFSLTRGGNGKIYIARASESARLCEIGSDGSIVSVPDNYFQGYLVQGYNDEFPLYVIGYHPMTLQGTIYGSPTTGMGRTEIAALGSLGIGTVYDIWLLKDGFIAKNQDGNVYKLHQVTENVKPESRVKLTLASLTGSDEYTEIDALVAGFNSENPDYYVEMTNFNDETGGITKFLTEIISGKRYDLYNFRGDFGPVERFVQLGLLEDLYPYWDSDPELSRDNVMRDIIETYEFNGKLYEAFSAVTISGALIGLADVVGKSHDWSFSEFIECYESNPNFEEPILGLLKMPFIGSVVTVALSEFYDRTSGTCTFDSPEFTEILEFANSIPDQTFGASYDNLKDGVGMTIMTSVYRPQILSALRLEFGNGYTLKGMPGVGFNYARSMSGANVAISSSSEHKDGAWQFARILFTDEYAESSVDTTTQFPVNKAAFETQIQECLNADPEDTVTIQNYGEQLRVPTAITQEDAGALYDLLAITDKRQVIDQAINRIIYERIDPFFSGEYTAEQTAKLIQSAVQLYLGEQMG